MTPRSERLILIGFRATGKTTVGRVLAARLGYTFIDVDEVIETGFGGTISEIFAREGETGFRDRESSALQALVDQNRCVVSTGGGAILRPENRKLIRSLGFVTWLTSEPETIWNRLQSDPATAGRRPNLTASGGLEEVRELLKVREPHYRESADFIVSANEISPESIAAAILTEWTGLSSSSGVSPFSSSASSSGHS